METKGFHIHAPGDPSVGIWATNRTLTGDMCFDSKESLEEFREAIRQAFANAIDDKIGVETFEEYDEMIRNEEQQLGCPYIE